MGRVLPFTRHTSRMLIMVNNILTFLLGSVCSFNWFSESEYGDMDYNKVYHDDCYGDILGSILDLPVEETLEEEDDGLIEDWGSSFGPIPSDVFRETLPPTFQYGGGGGGRGSDDLFTECHRDLDLNVENCQPNCQPFISEETFKSQRLKSQHQNIYEERRLYPMPPRSFEAPSPDSVLERRTTQSADKTISIATQKPLASKTRTRSKRKRATNNRWIHLIPVPKQACRKEKKKRRNLCQEYGNAIRKCVHCGTTKTPQWREGLQGPKTLCNACGVRHRAGRLYPEYRPAASPTFVPALHSNSHRKVMDMRQKGGGMNDNVVKKHLSSPNRLCSS